MAKLIESSELKGGESIEFVENSIICGDRLEILAKLPKKSVHLVITSPPYNVGIEYDKHSDNMEYDEYLKFLEKTWQILWDSLVTGGRICLNIPSITWKGEYQPLFSDVIAQMKRIGYIMRCDIIWHKQNISKRTAWGSWKSPSNPHVVQPYEFILVFSKEKKKLEGTKDAIDITAEEFIEFSNSLWNIKPETRKLGHPVPFPEELVYRLIKFFSFSGNVILDPFAGSGTVGVVAAKTKRKYICIDNSKQYCQIALERIKKEEKKHDKNIPKEISLFENA